MKTIIYYLLLLVFLAVVTGFILSGNGAGAMSAQQAITISALLVLYVVGISLVGEGKTEDERERGYRHLTNRAALISGTVIISLGIFYQLFTHRLDYWLLISLIVMNLTKIISLIYLNYKK